MGLIQFKKNLVSEETFPNFRIGKQREDLGSELKRNPSLVLIFCRSDPMKLQLNVIRAALLWLVCLRSMMMQLVLDQQVVLCLIELADILEKMRIERCPIY